MAGVWVFAETVDGVPKPVVLELLTKARSLGDAAAIALGPGASKSAATLGEYGASKVYVHEDPAFREVLATPAVDLLARLVENDRSEDQGADARPDPAESRCCRAGQRRRRAGGADADRSRRHQQAGRPGAPARNRKGERAQARGCHDHRQRWAWAGCA